MSAARNARRQEQKRIMRRAKERINEPLPAGMTRAGQPAVVLNDPARVLIPVIVDGKRHDMLCRVL